MNKPVAPDWLKEAIKNTRYDQLDPATKKAADRFMRELRKWERGGVPLKTIKKQERIKREQERIKEEQEFEKKCGLIDQQNVQYIENLLQEQENTIDWNWGGGCKWCGCQSLRVVKTPQYIHWGKFVCNLCHCHNDWIPYPKEGVIPFVDRSKTIGHEFK